MFGIPPAPAPQLTDQVAFAIAGGCVLVGVSALLWGRNLSRALLCAAGVSIGVVSAGAIAQRFGWPLMVVRLSAVVLLGLAALVTARMVWALLAGALFGLVGEVILLALRMGDLAVEQQPVFEAANETLTAWLLGLGQFLTDGLEAMFHGHGLILLATVVPAAAAPFLAVLIADRFGRIFMTSLVGGAGVVAGAVLAVVQLRPSLWESVCANWQALPAAAAALAIVGLVGQYRSAIRSDKLAAEKQADEDEEETEEDEDRPAKKAKKKTKKKKTK